MAVEAGFADEDLKAAATHIDKDIKANASEKGHKGSNGDASAKGHKSSSGNPSE
jgi:hypothetical protein